MTEWNEETLEEELSAVLEEIPVQEDIEKRIKKSIRRKIIATVLLTLGVTAFAAAIVFLVAEPAINHAYFDPYMLNKTPEKKLLQIFKAYTETAYPYKEVLDVQVQKKGFGRYRLVLRINDDTEDTVKYEDNFWCEMNKGKYENIIDGDSSWRHAPFRFLYEGVRKEDTIERIKELPKSAYLFLSVSGKKARPIGELRKLEVETEWVQVYQPEVTGKGGLSLNSFEPKYRREMTDRELLETYLSNLKIMSEYPKAWEFFGISNGANEIYNNGTGIRETYENAKKLKELTSKNYCVSGKRDEVLHFLMREEFDSVLVDKVLLWR